MFLSMINAYLAIKKNFGKPFSSVFLFIGLLILRIFAIIGDFLDKILFPEISKQEINKPIVIVGNPRSGTTFLQRFLVENCIGIGMPLWKMLFPSLVFQKIIKPFLPLLEKVSPARFHKHAAHKTNLLAVETDDPSLLFRYFDGFFVYGFFLAWADKDFKNLFDPDIRDTSKRDFEWFKKIWKVNLFGANENRVIAKLFSLGVRLPKFLVHFPDAKILYTIRDPLETVPSALSLVTGVLDGRYRFWKLPEERRSFYIERLYLALLDLSMRFYNDFNGNRINSAQIKIVKYSRLMDDFDALMMEIFDFIDIKPNDKLIAKVNATSEKQRTYKSEHKYELSKFGITEERIRNDYAKLYDNLL